MKAVEFSPRCDQTRLGNKKGKKKVKTKKSKEKKVKKKKELDWKCQ